MASSLFSLAVVISSVFAAPPISVTIPVDPSTGAVVKPNFLGISFEFSFIDQYLGKDASHIPAPMENYLSALKSRTGGSPLRMRIGGNSMDSSTYVPSQKSPMIQLVEGNDNTENQPATYGPQLWDLLNQVASDLGGAKYILGLPMLNPNNTDGPLIAGDAQKQLNSSLDGFLLGNEPDQYAQNGNRAWIANYSFNDYMTEFQDNLDKFSTAGVLNSPILGGPSVCCRWDLSTLFTDGFLERFTDKLKFVALQHYPQNNCNGPPPHGVSYYMDHSTVVRLAAWQKPGLDMLFSSTSVDRPQLIMSEFNSVSCGGKKGVSDTFAVGSLWSANYALQLASIGYTAAFLHTREQGISYNVMTPPDGSNGGSDTWTTNSPFYALLAVSETLQSPSGNSIVTDLNVNGSQTDPASTVGGYIIRDHQDLSIQQLVFFNYVNSTSQHATFSIPAGIFKSNLTVKYLAAPNANEKTLISWGGQTLAGVGDGKLVNSSESWVTPNTQVDCLSGCLIDVPGPAMAMVSATTTTTSTTTGQVNQQPIKTPTTQNGAAQLSVGIVGLLWTLVLATLQLF